VKKPMWPFKRRSCLEWKGLLDEDGYGRVKVNNTDTRVHRAFFSLWYGVKLEPSDVLLHECDNPRCFNPFHLRKGTQAENIRDMDEKGRRVSSGSLVTHCPQGHEYTVENTKVYKDGKRRCVTCAKQRNRKPNGKV
jgi:formylmethanofuran dehydrogenase subunit E